VDDGKSTLIGRMLYDCALILDDQLATLERESQRFGTAGDDIDFSLLLDGLEDERQQRITIDVAYRFFATPERAFVVADTPGHEQYTRNMATGAFILIDRFTNQTAGAGMIAFGLWRASNLHWQALTVGREQRAAVKEQRAAVLWFTGLSGAGKSTIADLAEKKLLSFGRHTMLLDGDNVRHGLNRDLGFTDADRVENIRRVGEVAKLMTEAGLIVLCSFISPFRAERRMVRELTAPTAFLEIFVDTPLDECIRRDPKGLYAKAKAGRIPHFTGLDSPYEAPESPELRVTTMGTTPESVVEHVLDELRRRNII